MPLNGATSLDVARQIGASVNGLVTFINTTTHGALFNDNVECRFGTTELGGIYHDGTNMIIRPGPSTNQLLRIGAATTDQGCLHTYRIGLGDTVATSGALFQFTTSSSAIGGVLTGSFTHTGSVNTLRTLLFTCIHQGTTTGAQTSLGGLFTGNSNSDTSTGVRACIGVQAAGGFASGQVMTQGTHDYTGCVVKAGTVGGTHTGGTIRSRNLLIEKEPTYVGVTPVVNVAAQCQGTFHLLQNEQFVVEGTALAPGNSYFVFNSATTDWDFFVDGTKTHTLDNDAIDYFVLQRQGDNIETRWGTGEDVSVTYTGSVWDFNILQATTEIVFNNAGIDTDFRIESDGDADMFFVNAGTNRVGISTNAPTQTLGVDGHFALETAGNTIHIKQGSNASMGRAVLVAGTVTVNNTLVATTDEIFLTRRITGGTVGHLSVGTVTAATSFVINSTSATDTSTICWWIVRPA